jgi:glucokinase
MSRHLGLDLGGTAIKAVVLERGDDGGYRETWKHMVDTRSGDPPEGIVEQLAEVGRDLAVDAGGVDTCGVTIPGTFDLETGVARFVTNLGGPAWEGVHVREPVERTLGVPTSLVNDARAFGFAESRVGAARDCDTAAFYTLGTGVGGAVVVGGRLQLGYGTAGELGHVTVDARPDAPLCGCGNRGCLEAHVKAAAVARAGGRPDAEQVIDAAQDGDERARAGLAEVGRWLGVGIAIVVMVVNPERVVVGGGIVEAGELILGPAREEVRRRVTVPPSGLTEIVPTQLGREAGSIGAALWGAERP